MSIKKPNFLEQDKWEHLIIAFPIGMSSFVATHIFLENLLFAILISTFLVLLLGIAKEISDSMNPFKKLFDINDVIATTIGGLLGGTFCLILYLIFG